MDNNILKKGADYLLKGGTLLSEPCQKCNGLLIKYKDNTICLNCQRSEHNDSPTSNNSNLNLTQVKKESEDNQRPQSKDNINKINDSYEIENYHDLLLQIEKTMIKRIVESNKIISKENDLDKQQKNIKILFLALKVLKKIKEIQ